MSNKETHDLIISPMSPSYCRKCDLSGSELDWNPCPEYTPTPPTNPKVSVREEDLDKEINDLIAQTYCQTGCDGYGTYPEADEDGDATPAQCQYCYQVRFPAKERFKALISDREQKGELDGRIKQTQWFIDYLWNDKVKPDEIYPRLKAEVKRLAQLKEDK